MKLLHVSDLHIGKRLLEQSLKNDQQHMLKAIADMAREHEVDALLICGDVYDKNVPSEEAVALFDAFLAQLAAQKTKTYIIAGNHDSRERLHFASGLLAQSGIHIVTDYDGQVAKHTLQDDFGEVALYMLPFVKPASVAAHFDTRPDTYTRAVQWVLDRENIDTNKRNVIMAHQFVTAAGGEVSRSDSEQLSTGGMDNVDVSVFDKFDYVALGHIHGPQRVGRDTVRYSGSMLKYSFSEQYHQKGALLIGLKQKGEVEIDKLPFDMPTEMATLQGKMQDILDNATPGDTRYLQVVLTDDTPLYNAIGTLKAVYPNLLALKFAPGSAVAVDSRTAAKNVAHKTPMQLFEDLFAMQNGMEMSEYQQDLINKMWEDEA